MERLRACIRSNRAGWIPRSVEVGRAAYMVVARVLTSGTGLAPDSYVFFEAEKGIN